jgi:hypothetical protein
MTAAKPTTNTPASPIPKKAVKVIKKAANVKFGRAATSEKNSIDALLQGNNKHRRYARRGSKTPGMLKFSASRVVFDSELSFNMHKVKSETGISLVMAFRLNIVSAQVAARKSASF